MSKITWVFVVLAIIAVLLAIWSPWLWQSLVSAVFLFIVAAGIHGSSSK